MFLFLFLSSRSMMKCCVLTGSMIRLGIVLLSPHSQALRPGHAAAVRHLGGFPPLQSFLYQGFLLLWTGAAGIHQQLSPDWRGSTPSSSFSCSSSPPPTSLLKTTHTHTVPRACLPSLDALLPSMSLCFLFSLLPLLLKISTALPRWMIPTVSALCALLTLAFCLMQMNVTVAGKLWPWPLEE